MDLSGNRKWAAVAVAVVVALGAGFLAGFMVERSARQDAQTAASELETQLQEARGQTAAVEARNSLLAANVLVFQAATALDNRNFGVANDLMGQVRGNLERVDATAVQGVDPDALQAVREQANAVQLGVAANFEGQRDQLLGLASDLTAMTEPAP